MFNEIKNLRETITSNKINENLGKEYIKTMYSIIKQIQEDIHTIEMAVNPNKKIPPLDSLLNKLDLITKELTKELTKIK